MNASHPDRQVDRPEVAPDREDVPGAQALLKGLDVLLAIGAAPGPVRFRDIEQTIDMPRASLHRLLAALVSRNLIRYDSRKRQYELGTRVLELSRRTLDRNEVIRAAKPEMARLARETQRTICLHVLDRHEVFVLDFEDADPSYGRLVRLWPRRPILECAAGRAILAAMPRDAAIALITAADGARLPGDRTMADIDVGKALGYAVMESEPGVGRPAAAAAVFDENGFPVAALSCLFESANIEIDLLHETARRLVDASRRASRQIGIGPETAFVASRSSGRSDPRIEVLPTGRDFVGESPLWDARRGRVYWVDVLAPALRWWDAGARQSGRLPLTGVTAGLTFDTAGRIMACGQGGFSTIDPETGRQVHLLDPEADRPDNRFNTAGVDHTGRIWAATMAMDLTAGRGALYSLGTNLAVRRHAVDVGLPKNPAFSGDGRRLYLADAARSAVRLFAFDPATGELGAERPFVTAGSADGRPNGIAIDAEDHVWVTWLGGWSVRRYDPEGRLVESINLPVPMPTSCAFGGPEMDTLYVTSTYIRMPPGLSAEAPAAGQLLAIRLRPLGRAPSLFGQDVVR